MFLQIFCHLKFLSFLSCLPCSEREIKKSHLYEVKLLISHLDLVLEYAYFCELATAVNLPFKAHIEQNWSSQSKDEQTTKTHHAYSFIILFILLSHVLDRLLMFFTK